MSYLTYLFLCAFASAAPVKVGVILDQTTIRSASEETVRGLQIGVDYLKKSHGPNVEVTLMDSGPLASGTHSTIVDALKQNFDILVAEIASSKAEVAAQVAEKNKRVMLTTFATAESITQNRRYVFRACALHSSQTQMLAKMFLHKGWKRGGIVFDRGQLYSSDLAREFREQFIKDGGQLEVYEGTLSSADSFGDTLTKVRAAGLDFLFLPMYEDVTSRFLSQLLSGGHPTFAIVGGDGWTPGSVFKSLVLPKDDKIEFSIVSHHNPLSKKPLQLKFQSMYEARYGTAPEISASYLAFDTMLVIGKVFAHGKKMSQDALRKRLAQQINLEGTTGKIVFKNHQDPVNKTLYLNYYKGAKIQKVEALQR